MPKRKKNLNLIRAARLLLSLVDVEKDSDSDAWLKQAVQTLTAAIKVWPETEAQDGR